jgi:hypothetical protein
LGPAVRRFMIKDAFSENTVPVTSDFASVCGSAAVRGHAVHKRQTAAPTGHTGARAARVSRAVRHLEPCRTPPNMSIIRHHAHGKQEPRRGATGHSMTPLPPDTRRTRRVARARTENTPATARSTCRALPPHRPTMPRRKPRPLQRDSPVHAAPSTPPHQAAASEGIVVAPLTSCQRRRSPS